LRAIFYRFQCRRCGFACGLPSFCLRKAGRGHRLLQAITKPRQRKGGNRIDRFAVAIIPSSSAPNVFKVLPVVPAA
jgi:hypothetical protein